MSSGQIMANYSKYWAWNSICREIYTDTHFWHKHKNPPEILKIRGTSLQVPLEPANKISNLQLCHSLPFSHLPLDLDQNCLQDRRFTEMHLIQYMLHRNGLTSIWTALSLDDQRASRSPSLMTSPTCARTTLSALSRNIQPNPHITPPYTVTVTYHLWKSVNSSSIWYSTSVYRHKLRWRGSGVISAFECTEW
jgi:hypothetical protein